MERNPNTAPPNAQPGFAAPAAPAAPDTGATFTEAQVQEKIAAALAAAQKPAQDAQPAAPVAPPAFLAEDSGIADPVLSSFTDAFSAMGGGIDINRAIGNALTHGNAALIDSAYIAEKGGAHAAQLQTIAKAIVDRVQTQTAAATDAVYATAGSKEQWNTAVAVFDQSAPAHLKLVIKGLLESGKPDTIKAGAQTVLDYVKQNGLVVNPAQLLNAGANGASAAQALSKEEFQTEHRKLDPNSRTYQQDRDALFARRAVGKQLGK